MREYGLWSSKFYISNSFGQCLLKKPHYDGNTATEIPEKTILCRRESLSAFLTFPKDAIWRL